MTMRVGWTGGWGIQRGFDRGWRQHRVDTVRTRRRRGDRIILLRRISPRRRSVTFLTVRLLRLIATCVGWLHDHGVMFAGE